MAPHPYSVSPGFLLLERSTTIPQGRTPRRAAISGMVGVHTTEGALDRIAPDTGAENVANFIATRSDYGSYHEVVDTDSVRRIAPDEWETWHIGADAHNWHAWGISAACRATEWDPDSDWTRQVIAIMGERIAAFWTRQGFLDVARNPRWLTRDQALRHLPGLVHHGVAQPADRSDAWVAHPQRARLDAMLLDAIRAAAGGTPTPDPEELTVADITAITNALNALSKQVAALEANVAAWERDTRQYEGLVPVKKRWDPAQYLVTFQPGRGWVKIHLPGDPGAVPLLRAQGTIQAAVGGLDEHGKPAPFRLLSDTEAAWLDSLPAA